jgi:hypothetical protein
MGEECSKYWRDEICVKIFSGEPKRKRPPNCPKQRGY